MPSRCRGWKSPIRDSIGIRKQYPQPKQTNLAGQTIEQRLAPWIEHHNSRVEKDGFVGVSKEDVVRGQVDTGRDDWNANDDEFDYSALADRLK